VRDVDHGTVLRRALAVALSGDNDEVAELFTEDVCGWSPTIVISSRAELVEQLDYYEDALSDLELTVDAVYVSGDVAVAEWRVRAVFSGPFLIDDDVLVEPTGEDVTFAGAAVAELSGGRIRRFRLYFDDAAFLEQVLSAT
jgi:ketosteroid isomerase-like protein